MSQRRLVERTYDALSGVSARALLDGKLSVDLMRHYRWTDAGLWVIREVFERHPTLLRRLYFRYILWRAVGRERHFPWGIAYRVRGGVVVEATPKRIDGFSKLWS
jgi:hypothetical protein